MFKNCLVNGMLGQEVPQVPTVGKHFEESTLFVPDQDLHKSPLYLMALVRGKGGRTWSNTNHSDTHVA